jgi:hypothetical protein
MDGPWVEFSAEWKLMSTSDAEDPLSGGRVDMFKFSPDKLELPDEVCLITKGVVIFVPNEEIQGSETYCYILSSPEAPPTQIVLSKYTDLNGKQAFKGELPKKMLRKHDSKWEITATLFTGQSGTMTLDGVKVGIGAKKGKCTECIIL